MFYGWMWIIILLIVFSFVYNFKRSNINDITQLRVMTFNIHYGNDYQEIYDINEIGKVIKDSNSDVVCLQEVAVNWDEASHYEDTLKILADITNMEYYNAYIYNKNSSRGEEFPNEQFGVAFLSKYPIVYKENHEITRWSTQPEDPQPGDPDFPGLKPGFGEIIINVNGKYVRVYNTHLDYRPNPPEGYTESIRKLQVEDMMQIMETDSFPTILMGDMNTDTSSKEVFDPLFEKFYDGWSAGEGDGFTFPCNKPDRRIDYILVNDKIRAVKSYNIETLVSDHLPVVTDIEFY